jgi:membrane glycosyltransferase
MEAAAPAYAQAVASAPDLVAIATDPVRKRLHLALVDRLPERPRGQVNPTVAIVEAKIAEAETVDEAISFLDRKERAALIATPRLIEGLSRLPRQARVSHVCRT